MFFELPDSLKIEEKSIGSIISISTVIGLITSLLSYFKLDNIDIPYRIIIILSLLLLIAIVDIVILYVRDREKQYFQCYLNSTYKNLEAEFKMINSSCGEIRNQILDYKKKFDTTQNLKSNN